MALTGDFNDKHVHAVDSLMLEIRPESEWDSAGRDPVHGRMITILTLVLIVASLTFFALHRLRDSSVGSTRTSVSRSVDTIAPALAAAPPPQEVLAQGGGGQARGGSGSGQISPVFSDEVRYWEAQIVKWASDYDLDPDLVAIIMQVESCGDPGAESGAGAQGLFQVMPFHFTAGEVMKDPDTNARRGLNYFVEGLDYSGNDIGRTYAGYNGGHGTAAKAWNLWPSETQRYYTWTTGIYEDIQAGLETSPTLAAWLAAGGAGLCQQAASRLALSG